MCRGLTNFPKTTGLRGIAVEDASMRRWRPAATWASKPRATATGLGAWGWDLDGRTVRGRGSRRVTALGSCGENVDYIQPETDVQFFAH